MNHPWMKFYPSDWRADPALRMCSLAARGLWIDLICYMHEGEPYGHLTINGASPKLDQIASLVGRPGREVEKAFGELVSLGVLSSENGAILSRRMVRDNEKSEEGRKQVGKRWANRSPNRSPNRSNDEEPNRSPNTEPITLEARSQKPERKKEPSLRSGPRPKTRMPENWEPSEADREFALGLGIDREKIESEFPRCRDHFRATGQARADWSATWRNWCRRHLEIGNGGQNGRGQKPNADAGRGGLAGTLAKLKEHVERVRDGAEDRSGPPPPRLLSYGGG